MSGASDPARRAARIARRIMRRRTYPRPSFEGRTPSETKILIARPCSAIRRIAMSVFSSRPSGAFTARDAVSMSGAKRSVANTDSTPLRIERTRSKPAPVSMFFFGRSMNDSFGPFSNCMNTRFQNSMKRSSPPCAGPPSAPNDGPLS